MKQSYTYNELHYISETSDVPENFSFDEPKDGSTVDIKTGWALMGTGVQSISEAPNAETSETAYINQISKSTTVDSYNFKFTGTADKIVNEKAVMLLHDIAYYSQTGDNAQRNFIIVDESQPYGEGKYKARLLRVSCGVTNITKDAAQKINFDFELSGVKDAVHGTFEKETKIFTVADTKKPFENITTPPENGGNEESGTEEQKSIL